MLVLACLLQEDFLFVGIMERWEDTVNVFHQKFGGKVLPIELMVNRKQVARVRTFSCLLATLSSPSHVCVRVRTNE